MDVAMLLTLMHALVMNGKHYQTVAITHRLESFAVLNNVYMDLELRDLQQQQLHLNVCIQKELVMPKR